MKSYPYQPNEGRRPIRNRGLVALAAILSSFGLLALTTGALDVARNTEQLLDNERLRSELRHFKQENQDLRQTLQRVGKRLSSLELLAEEVQGLSRLAAKRGRNGGPSQVYFSQLTFSEAAARRCLRDRRPFAACLRPRTGKSTTLLNTTVTDTSG